MNNHRKPRPPSPSSWVELSSQNTKFTAACATACLRAHRLRPHYYWFQPWRSAIWFVFLATFAMIVSLI
jgi:hypothetical protein